MLLAPPISTEFFDALNHEPLSAEIRYELQAPSRLKITGRGALLTVEPQDIVADSNRAEIKVMAVGQLGQVVWYAYELFIPSNYIESQGYEILGQLHDGPPFTSGSHPPLLALRHFDDRVDFVYGKEPPQRFYSPKVPLERGMWHRIVWRVDWSMTTLGNADVWLDHVLVKHFEGSNAYGMAQPYMKLGIYRPQGGSHKATIGLRNWTVSLSPVPL